MNCLKPSGLRSSDGKSDWLRELKRFGRNRNGSNECLDLSRNEAPILVVEEFTRFTAKSPDDGKEVKCVDC